MKKRAIARRIRDARFPNQGSLEDFDWSFNAAAIDRTQIEQLATGDWVDRFENLVMLDQSGVGKSRLLDLGDTPLAMALLDRVVDRAVLLNILGKSYRASRAKRSKASRPPEPNT